MKKTVLCKGLIFAILLKTIEYSEFLLLLEMLFRDFNSIGVVTLTQNVLKVDFEVAYTSFWPASKISEKTLFAEEVKALNNLVKTRCNYPKGRKK